MTTRVTVDAHAGWDVKVVLANPNDEDAEDREEIVSAHTTKDFYIHDSANIVLIEEVKKTG